MGIFTEHRSRVVVVKAQIEKTRTPDVRPAGCYRQGKVRIVDNLIDVEIEAARYPGGSCKANVEVLGGADVPMETSTRLGALRRRCWFLEALDRCRQSGDEVIGGWRKEKVSPWRKIVGWGER